MSILSPSKLETIDYGQQFWQAVFNSNAQKVNEIFAKFPDLWDGTPSDGQVLTYDQASGLFVATAVPYPVPQATVDITIGAGEDTTISATCSKTFALTLTKATNLVVTHLSAGMFFDLIITQDATGGWEFTAGGCTILGTPFTDPNIHTWVKCAKIGSNTIFNVVANYLEP